MTASMRSIGVAIALVGCLNLAEWCQADMTYLALGDSVSFGWDPSTAASMTPSYADQGFVRPFADFLASSNGGVRPGVQNLAVSGELSTSFFTGSPPPGWSLRAPELNLNYPNTTTSQNDLMISTIQSIHAAGGSIGFASFLIGSNDIFYLLGTPAFQGASAADQQAMLGATIGNVLSNYQMVLGELKTLAPEATILLPGYYNPFPSAASEHALYDSILGVFNPAVRAYAQGIGGRYVDLQSSFAGRELELTNIGAGDVHPNQAGYAVIARDLESQAVPEPTGVILLGIGLLGLLGYRRRQGARKP